MDRSAHAPASVVPFTQEGEQTMCPRFQLTASFPPFPTVGARILHLIASLLVDTVPSLKRLLSADDAGREKGATSASSSDVQRLSLLAALSSSSPSLRELQFPPSRAFESLTPAPASVEKAYCACSKGVSERDGVFFSSRDGAATSPTTKSCGSILRARFVLFSLLLFLA